ncbi:BppU family phage baseplate upper protein [Lactiplantibacillus plantarum]|uniref:BppU family phage baseplate upper protein n=1 Tax=Lactiplantibacillus plantarum TaxID=1590 RepID=UPI003F52E096
MVASTDYLVIDLAMQTAKVKPIGDYLFARQGDNRRPLPVWFKQNDQPFPLTDYSVIWEQTNAQGTPLTVEGVTINGAAVGQVIFYYPSQVFAVPGTVTGHFAIKNDGQVISSIDMTFEVAKDNVLVGIDTTPFLNDWEKFKSSLQTETDQIKSSLSGLQTQSQALSDQAAANKQLVEDNAAAKKTDLANFLKTSGDQTLSGKLIVSDLGLTNNGSMIPLVNAKSTTNVWGEKQSGLYYYDASVTGTVTPPYLPDNYKTGYVLFVYQDDNNFYMNWLGSGWEEYKRNGVYANWLNKTGVQIYNGSWKLGDTIQLACSSQFFNVLHFHIYLNYQHKYIDCFFMDKHLMFIMNNSTGTHIYNIYMEFPDSTHIKMAQFKDQLISQSTSTDVTDAISVEIMGIRITES